MTRSPKRYDASHLVVLLRGGDLDPPWRWHRAWESPGIYFEPMGGVLTRRELDAVTGYLVGPDRPQGPALSLPCTLNELLAFEDAAGVFRDRLEAGDETKALLEWIAAHNPEAGKLARALLKASSGKPSTPRSRHRQPAPRRAVPARARPPRSGPAAMRGAGREACPPEACASPGAVPVRTS